MAIQFYFCVFKQVVKAVANNGVQLFALLLELGILNELGSVTQLDVSWIVFDNVLDGVFEPLILFDSHEFGAHC